VPKLPSPRPDAELLRLSQFEAADVSAIYARALGKFHLRRSGRFTFRPTKRRTSSYMDAIGQGCAINCDAL
jgi:hypothetical protein